MENQKNLDFWVDKMEKTSDGRDGKLITKILRGQRLTWSTKHGKHQRKQAKVEECPRTEIRLIIYLFP